jgi:hypothetical protein
MTDAAENLEPQAGQESDETLFDGLPADGASNEGEVATGEVSADSSAEHKLEDRPEWVPEKFWDADKKEVRVEALAKSYSEAEKRIHQKAEPPETYEIKNGDDIVELDDKDIEQFRTLGLTNDQAQGLVQWFQSEIVPEIADARVATEKARLANLWGMQDEGKDSTALEQRMLKVQSWAKANLPESAVKEAAKSAHGINSLYKMMESGYKGGQPESTTPRRSKAELEALMQDERYYNDETYQRWVRQQFVDAFDR